MANVTTEPRDIRSDMLAQTSTVQETLRAMYLYGVDYILLIQGKSERLVHKEQLVALLEQGRDRATLEDIFSMALREPLSAKMQMEDVPTSTCMLIFAAAAGDQPGELEKLTFAEYRQRKIEAAAVAFPEWWTVPLPLVHIDEERVYLNPQGEKTIPGGAAALARQIEQMRVERIVTIKERKAERTFSLLPLGEDTFLAEDISGDFEMAEDLVWWAAIGKAFVGRMKENGLIVKRLSPYEDPPPAAAEIIPCSWEGELIGRLAIEVPAADTPEAVPGGERDKMPEAPADEKPAPQVDPGLALETPSGETEPGEGSAEPAVEAIPPVSRKKPSPSKKAKAPIASHKVGATAEIKEPEPESINMKKTAARNAYGMKGKSPVARTPKNSEDGKNSAGVAGAEKNGEAATSRPKKRAKSG